MIEPKTSPDEEARLAAVKRLKILDTPPEERFDRITNIAARLFNAPISTITLIDSKREFHKSCYGLSEREGARAISFCGHAILNGPILIVPDALKDERFSDNPLVTGPPYVRFYAGVPLLSADGYRIGTLCVKDRKPRELTKEEIQILKDLASWVELEMNSRELSLALETLRKNDEKIRDQLTELEKVNKIMVGRELKMIELKKEVEGMKKKV